MVKIDAARREVKIDGKFVHLAPKEFDILTALKNADGRVLSRQYILTTCWGPRFVKWDRRIVDTHIGRIRRQLKKFKAQGLIVTVNCHGYKFKRA